MAITNWPNEERPREKLFIYGPKTLSNAKLLAIFLHTGIPGENDQYLFNKLPKKDWPTMPPKLFWLIILQETPLLANLILLSQNLSKML